MGMVDEGTAFCVPGNHDMKLMRKLKGRDVQLTHGLADSITQLDKEPPEFKQQVVKFLDDLVSHYVFDDGKLVVAHAGMKEEMQGRGSGKVRDFALYGETTGETDEYSLPVRYNWAAEYRGKAMVVYGHTRSPLKAAMKAMAVAAMMFIRPAAASAPTASNTGAEGRGTPNCSNRTQPKSSK
jgi:protein phosphatase